MIWYLLFPLRGTSDPPRLSDNHPIRRAFYRHGMLAAQHWLWVMLGAVAVGVALSYPTVFLSENPTAGFTSIPHHVWTTAKPADNSDVARADVEMRQVWVHGSYMRALEKDVLKSALTIQQTLVGDEKLASIFPALGEKLKYSELSWGYHSPLMYWNNSAENIDGDLDVVRTVNEQARTASSLNVALRPASVLAGKTFHHRKLIAADALVLTLMNKVEDGVGGQWQDKMHSLEGQACLNCTLYPPHGEISRSRVYDFSFTPLSLRENVALAFAYGCMALYVTISLRRLKAFHSRFGLVVTVITQITTSILASFTICGMLKINLATIPQNAYPFVVLVLGVENVFRLINAVLAYPPTMSTHLRIANALGDVGPLSIATAVQNLIILWLLAIVVSPGVKAFCAFAAIATLFDSFFLLTFFVAVLNVDIRRLELQDSIARSNQTKHKRKRSPVKKTWVDALMHGRLPFSTRMAGSATTTAFILSLNYHFFEHKERALNLRHLLGLFLRKGTPDLADFDSFAPPPMNATLTPGEWIRMQDFDTAREVMRLVKPGSNNFKIRIFSPLIVVLANSDRTGVPHGVNVLSEALRGFALHHFYPFAVVVVFVVAFVAVLMNFLLWNEAPDTADSPTAGEDSLGVQHITLPHRLDIVKMQGSRKGHFVTVALDRSVAVAIYDRSQGFYMVDTIPAEVTSQLAWPIHHIAVDDAGELIAFCGADERVVILERRSRTFNDQLVQYPDDNPPVLLAFEQLNRDGLLHSFLVVVTSGGRVAILRTEDEVVQASALTERPLLGASMVKHGQHEQTLYVIQEDGVMKSFTHDGMDWAQVGQSEQPLGLAEGAATVESVPDSDGKVIIVSTKTQVFVVDAVTMTTMSATEAFRPSELVGVVPGHSTLCHACSSPALRELCLVSTSLAGDLKVSTKLGEKDAETARDLCLRPSKPECLSLETAMTTTQGLHLPGTFQVISSRGVLGLRKRPIPEEQTNGNGHAPELRRRRQARHKVESEQEQDEWEAYAFSTSGEMRTQDIPVAGDHEMSLYVTEPGPIVPLDAQSVAVGLGNAVKVLRVSSRNGGGGRTTGAPALERHGSTTASRKRLGVGRKAL